MASPVGQSVNLTLPDGQVAFVPLALVDENTRTMVVKSIAYGVEMGASLVMLAVILTMTPRTKFWRLPTYLNIASLCNNAARVLLLAIYFESSWVSFYALYGGDYDHVTSTALANTVASTALTVPQNIMMMSALILQAWVMVRLWPDLYRWAIVSVSVVLVLLEIGFMGASTAYQIMQMFLDDAQATRLVIDHLWVRYCFLGLEVACISWFCFLFSSKLAVHLWRNRSFLPTTKGLGAMDALVMTNGVLMLIPLFLAGLQYSWSVQWEAASMVYTAVIVILPLGTLVAQRIADPAAFDSALGSGGAGAGGSARLGGPDPNARDPFGHYASCRKGSAALLNPTWSQSDRDSVVFPGRRASRGARAGAGAGDGRPTGVTAVVTSGGPPGPADVELARIDADVEAGRVRVDREIQRLEEVL